MPNCAKQMTGVSKIDEMSAFGLGPAHCWLPRDARLQYKNFCYLN